MPRSFGDPDACSARAAKCLQRGVDQLWICVDRGAFVELHQIRFEDDVFVANIDMMMCDHAAQQVIKILRIGRAMNRNGGKRNREPRACAKSNGGAGAPFAASKSLFRRHSHETKMFRPDAADSASEDNRS